MRTTIGQLVCELVEEYERIYHDHELATVAASVTLDDLLHEQELALERENEPTQRMRRMR